MKKPSNLSVGIKKKISFGNPKIIKMPETKRAFKGSERFVERELFGLNKKLKQRTYFLNNKKILVMDITDGIKSFGNLQITVKDGNGIINWVGVEKEIEKKGVAFQMLTEALHILKKANVEYVSAHVLSGLRTYKKLGFEIRNRFGETWVYKKLN